MSELSVIVWVVALAAGLLVTACRARETARRDRCVNNLNQIAQAMRAYLATQGGGVLCNALQLDKLIPSLPTGWEAKVARPEGHGGYGTMALFEVELVFPSAEYEIDTMSGRRKVHPSLWLSFYAPFSEEQYEQFKKKVEEVTNGSLQPAHPPLLLARAENYWLFTTADGTHFGHPKEKEIYQHLKDFLSINGPQLRW